MASFSYNKRSRVHARGSRRRLFRRIGLFLICVGILSITAHLFFAIKAMDSEYDERKRMFTIMWLYLGLGVGSTVLGQWLRTSKHRSSEQHSGRKRKRRRKHSDRGGSVLVMVLVMLTLLSGLALAAQLNAHAFHRSGDFRLRTHLLRIVAADAIRDAMHRLSDDEDIAVDHLDEPWAQPTEFYDPEGNIVHIVIVDENRFFDFNNLAVETPRNTRPVQHIVQDIMTLGGDFTPMGRVDALLDWIDTDSGGRLESQAYQHQLPRYTPANRIILGWNEALLVKGFDRERFGRSTPREGQNILSRSDLVDTMTFLPVPHTRVIPININTASEQTLHGVIGIGKDQLLSRVLDRRSQGPFRRLDAAQLAVDPKEVEHLLPYISVRSTYFRIAATAAQNDHATRIEALVQRDAENNVTILQWLY